MPDLEKIIDFPINWENSFGSYQIKLCNKTKKIANFLLQIAFFNELRIRTFNEHFDATPKQLAIFHTKKIDWFIQAMQRNKSNT